MLHGVAKNCKVLQSVQSDTNYHNKKRFSSLQRFLVVAINQRLWFCKRMEDCYVFIRPELAWSLRPLVLYANG